MSSTKPDRDSLRQLVTDAVLAADFRRATFGGPLRGPALCAWLRVTVRPVELRGERHLQFSYFDSRKDVTKNYRDDEIPPHLNAVLDAGFSRIHLATAAGETDIQLTKKGTVLVGKRPATTAATAQPEPHNRLKDVPLPEGRADRLLETLGILTRAGQVRPTMRAKYTQINEFLKQLRHALDGADLAALGRPVEILDCGCGSSYLTLAAHHYLNDVLGIPANILGVDVNEEVIRKSIEQSERLGADRPTFTCAPIGAVAAKADIVLALHACDTATDDAIAQAVVGEASILLSVPCCHHHLNAQLRAEGPAEVLRPLLRHGILRQRTGDLVTDAFRALALRLMGYRTDVVEFVGTEHTARNLMLRAVRGAPVGDAELVREYIEMRRFWGVTPYIEDVLGERFGWLLADRG
jgi:hypothetical protein